MGNKRCKGAMTVFFSILAILFLSFACSLAESARIQGARVKASTVMDMGLFSVFGEYERELLEVYDVFGVDAAAGGMEFSAENLGRRLDAYMQYNIKGKSLFPMDQEESQVTEYLLLTDETGKVFRDQVVQNWKSAFGTEILAEYLEARQKGEELQKAGETYEKKEAEAKAQLEQAEETARQETEQERELPAVVEGSSEVAAEKTENPLVLIEKIKKRGILGLVMKDPEKISQKSVEKESLPSVRKLETGTMSWVRSESGFLEDGIFQQYLFEHFSCVTDETADGALDYELEYLLTGKTSDQQNLKAVVHKLLLLREGVNFLYVLSNTEMRQSVEVLAAAISGGIPGLTAALGAALLAAWAYGESLLDVRILLSGGKVPVVKTKETFRLTLENLGRLMEILKECDSVEGKGLGYRGYLQMLFLMGEKTAYPMRALDLVECTLKKKEGMSAFQVDHCIAGMTAEVNWTLEAVFSKIPEAFLGTGFDGISYGTRGRFIYQAGE